MRQTYGFTLIQILCVTDGATLLERFTQRAAEGARHSGHGDLSNRDEWRAGLLRGRADPLPIAGALLDVDTTDTAAMR